MKTIVVKDLRAILTQIDFKLGGLPPQGKNGNDLDTMTVYQMHDYAKSIFKDKKVWRKMPLQVIDSLTTEVKMEKIILLIVSGCSMADVIKQANECTSRTCLRDKLEKVLSFAEKVL
jgi:hypothetical protein